MRPRLLLKPVMIAYRISRSEFALTADKVRIMFAHVSNAYLGDPTEDLDTLGIRYGYRF